MTLDRRPAGDRAAPVTDLPSTATAGTAGVGKRTLTEALGSPAPAAPAGAPVQLQVREAGGDRPAEPAAVHEAAGRGVATAPSALPHRETIQSLFGRHDISSVQAHVGPEAAASARDMGAQAYATGQHVVLGAGADLFTVAHEAAHVVQQRGGVQLQGGVGAAGDGHERAADEVASLVVQGKSAEAALDRSAGGAPAPGGAVQRQAVPYHDQSSTNPAFVKHSATVTKLASAIDQLVTEARAMALDWRSLAQHSEPHVKNWAQDAQKYFDDPSTTPAFMHARFGYAIEALACARLPASDGGLAVSTQIAKGATRPDIVLFDDQSDVAWLDITSSDSARHIFGKDHAGWKNRPFVYEILYQPLNLTEVLTATPNPVYAEVGGFMAQKNQIRYEEETAQRNRLYDHVSALRDTSGWQTGLGNASTKQQTTRASLETGLGMNLGANPNQATRGALAVAGVNDGPFGFNRGETKTKSDAANRWVTDSADPRVKSRTSQLERDELTRVVNDSDMQRWKSLPLVGELIAEASQALTTDTVDSRLVERGVAVRVCIQWHEKLRGLGLRLRDHSQDPRVQKLLTETVAVQMSFPMTADFQLLQAWSLKTALLVQRCSELLELLRREWMTTQLDPRMNPGNDGPMDVDLRGQ